MATTININISGYGVKTTTESSDTRHLLEYSERQWQEDNFYTLLPGFSPVGYLHGERKLKKKKKKNCSNGQVCGFSCISKTKTCVANMTTAQLKEHNKAKRLAAAEKRKGAKGGTGAASQSETANHKPFMTEAEATEYVKDSVWADQTFYHGTSESGAKAITSDGVNISANNVGLFGQGFYLGGGEDGRQIGESYSSGAVLSMKVMTKKPLTVSDKGEYDDIMAKGVADGKLSRDYYDAIASGNRPTPEMFAQREREGAEYIKSLGYDAIHVKNLDYFVVFDPKQVAVFKNEKFKKADEDDEGDWDINDL